MKRIALLAGALVLSAACGPGSDEGGAPSAEEEVAETVGEAATDAPAEPDEAPAEERMARLGDFRPAASSGPVREFHDPHRDIGCEACHADPPGHRTHRTVECGECHDAPVGVAAGETPSREECMGCHHAPTRGERCTACHEPARELPGARVSVPIDVAGRDDDPLRDVTFRHDLHTAPACTECHRAGTTFTADLECVACHASHHRPDADCLACHAPLRLAAHDREVHDGCSGAACHTDPTVTSLPPTRSVCLSCHQEMTEHMVGRECAACHQVGGGAP